MAASQAAVATSSETADTTTHTVSLPSGIVDGSLVVVFFAHDGASSNTITWPDGWTPLIRDDTESAACGFEVAARFCDGTEGSTISVGTSSSELSVHRAVRISGHHATHFPEVAIVDGSSTTPDPPSLSPSWGSAEESLLYAVFANDNGNRTLSSAPTNYDATDVYATAAGGTGVGLGVGYRNASVTSEDPGNYTISNAQDWIAYTIAIRPSGADAVSATGIGTATNTSTVTTTAAAPSSSRVVMAVWWYDASSTVTGASDDQEGLTWVVDLQFHGVNDGEQNIAFLSADAPSGLTSGAVITPSFSGDGPDFGPGMAVMYLTSITGGSSGYVEDTGSGVENYDEAYTTDGLVVAQAAAILGFSAVSYTPGDHRAIGSTEIAEWNAEGSQYGAITFNLVGGSGGTIPLRGEWSATVGFQKNIAIAYKIASGGTSHALVGSAAGSSGATGALTQGHALAGQADGGSTTSGDLSRTVGLVGQADGGSGATGTLSLILSLVGQADGTSGATGDLSRTVGLVGQSDGVSGATGALKRIVNLIGSVAGSSGATGTLRQSHALSGQSDGDSGAIGSLTVSGALAVLKKHGKRLFFGLR